MLQRIRDWLWLPIILILIFSVIYGIQTGGRLPAGLKHYGIFSIFPALVTLFLCFYTRNVIFALFMGIALGGLITANYNLIEAYLIPSLGSAKYARILLVYLWALGGLIGIWNKNGGAQHFARVVAEKFVRSRRSAKVFAWIMGVIFHQGGTISTVLTGTTVRPVTDREKVSHEELSYIVDSTASPIATLIPFNAWPAYIGGLVAIDSLKAIIPDEMTGISYFFKAIPFNFYAIFAVLFTFLFAIDKMFFVGKQMKRAIRRVIETGQLDAPTARPMMSTELTETNVVADYSPSMGDFLVPLGVLLGFSIIPWITTGAPMIFEAFGLSVVSAMVYSKIRGMSLADIFDGFVDGVKGVTVGAIILGLAVTLGNVSESLGTSHYIIALSAGLIKQVPYLLPGVLLFVCMFISFSIGSSWGTYAVVYPIAMPLAYTVNPDPFYFTLNFAAIMGGAVFGDQCSPISDTTILSAMVSGADLMDHVNTQLPMALLAAGLAAVAYIIISYIHLL